MKVVWVTRSFLDYRIPVYIALNERLKGQLYLVYNADYIPDRVDDKIRDSLGSNAIGLRGEKKIGPNDFGDFLANKKVRIPYQPNLIKTVSNLEPDVLLSDGFFQWTYAALWLRKQKKIPHVMCYERTLHTERNAQKIRIWFRKFAAKYIDAYCASGRLCGEYLNQLGIDSSKITYGHMVADISGISGSRDDIIKRDDSVKMYLYVGKLIERKGIKELLKAWMIFENDLKDNIELQIVGDGPLKSYVIDFCEKNQLKTVKLLGYVDYDEMGKFYAKADIFLIPTLEDNWSLVVPEAMANGLPILSSIYNGCHPEYVTKKNGWTFDPLDLDNFYAKLKESYNSNNLNEMSAESIKVISKYTPQNAANSIFKAIEMITC